jgi:hypothetical protein
LRFVLEEVLVLSEMMASGMTQVEIGTTEPGVAADPGGDLGARGVPARVAPGQHELPRGNQIERARW